MKYSDKLKDPRWQKRRLEILQRDNWACVLCGDKESTLNVHHWSYSPGIEPWGYPDENLSTLCTNCHDAETEYRRGFEDELLGVFRSNHVNAVELGLLADRLHGCSVISGNPFNEIFFSICHALKRKETVDDLIAQRKKYVVGKTVSNADASAQDNEQHEWEALRDTLATIKRFNPALIEKAMQTSKLGDAPASIETMRALIDEAESLLVKQTNAKK